MKQLTFVFVALIAFGCGKEKPSANKAPLILHFMEEEKGIDPYPVRMIVTRNFLRMDEGNANDDFLLLDRHNGVVYSITHETESYYQFNSAGSATVSATKPALNKLTNDVSDMPLFQGIKPIYTTYSADEETCLEVVSVPGLHPQAVAAMREYLNIMSRQHARTLHRTPESLQQKCMLVNFVFEPTQHLEQGFPLRQWDFRGYSRNLVNFETQAIDPGLFKLPENYQKMGIE